MRAPCITRDRVGRALNFALSWRGLVAVLTVAAAILWVMAARAAGADEADVVSALEQALELANAKVPGWLILAGLVVNLVGKGIPDSERGWLGALGWACRKVTFYIPNRT